MIEKTNIVEDTAKLFRAIGHTVVRFQQVEHWLAEELASMLVMKEIEDQFVVSAAMSFKQKVDLLVELYPRRRNPQLPKVDIVLVRKALYAGEEFRNRVVHSLWTVESGEPSRWKQLKGSLKGRKGFLMRNSDADIESLEACNDALKTICTWSVSTSAELEVATQIIVKAMQSADL
ncbi:hypothetical protein [Undibacterium sp.]|uniref:hypothetical protein n=1 Tax=Undibacterium sp. TaxID=1914977 RepID=UPI00273033D7|nr:hypothetical protein [Undibacterium sp.]MDP1978289.1 hypothetical protein [Undibacterium sp.]